MVFTTDFNRQGLDALNAGLGLGQAMNQFRIQEAEQERANQLQPLKMQIAKSQLQGQNLSNIGQGLSNQEAEGQINAKERIEGMTQIVTAINLPYEKRMEYMKTVKASNKNPVAKEFISKLMEVDDARQIDILMDLAGGGGQGGKKTDSRSSEEKQFDKLVQLEKTGTPEQVDTFKRILKINTDKKLSAASEKQLITAQNDYIESGNSAREMELLANDVAKIDIGGGLKSTLNETLKDLLGSQDEVSALRRRYRGLRGSQAVANLPPGSASDVDVALALSGFPKENANSAEIQSFLRGSAKLSRINERFNEFKAEYIGDNSSTMGLIKAWKAKTADNEYLADILKKNDNISKIQSSDVMTDEDLRSKYGF